MRRDGMKLQHGSCSGISHLPPPDQRVHFCCEEMINEGEGGRREVMATSGGRSVELSAGRTEEDERKTEEEKKIFGFFGFNNTIKRTNGKSVR